MLHERINEKGEKEMSGILEPKRSRLKLTHIIDNTWLIEDKPNKEHFLLVGLAGFGRSLGKSDFIKKLEVAIEGCHVGHLETKLSSVLLVKLSPDCFDNPLDILNQLKEIK
jgi:hypothetical protein